VPVNAKLQVPGDPVPPATDPPPVAVQLLAAETDPMDGASFAVSRRKIWIELLLYPGHTLPTAAAPVVVAAGLALHDKVFHPLPIALAFWSSWLIHVAGVLTDNYVLVSRHPEVREHGELLDAIETGALTLWQLRLAITACLALAVLPGPYLLTVAGLPVLVLGAIGIAASLGYSAGRFALTRLGIADIAFFLMFGVAAVAGTYYVTSVPSPLSASDWGFVARALPSSALLVGLPVGALIANILLIDDLRDADFDRRIHWLTRPVATGFAWTRAEFIGLTVFAYLFPLWICWGLGFSAWVLLPWLTLPEALAVTRIVATRSSLEDLKPMTPRAARLGLLFAVLLAVGLSVRL